MTPQDALSRHKHLLRGGTTEAECWAKADEFTNRVCYDLREQGWRRVKKTTGHNCAGLNCDLIVNDGTREMRDVVANGGLPNQEPAWLDKGVDGPRNLTLVMPLPYDGVVIPGEGEGQTPPPPTPPVDLAPVLAAIEGLRSDIAALRSEIAALRGESAGSAQLIAVAANESFNAAGRASEIKDALKNAALTGRVRGWGAGPIDAELVFPFPEKK